MDKVNRVEITLTVVEPVRFEVTKDLDSVVLKFVENEESVTVPISGDFPRSDFPLDTLLSLIDNGEYVNLALIVYM